METCCCHWDVNECNCCINEYWLFKYIHVLIPQITKQQLQQTKDRFQAFLNGDTQIVADEAFINAVQSYNEVQTTGLKPFIIFLFLVCISYHCIWLWFETPNNKIWLSESGKCAIDSSAAPCQTADIQTRARALKWGLTLVAAQIMSQSKWLTQPSFPAPLFLFHQSTLPCVKYKTRLCVRVWMSLDDDRIRSGRKQHKYDSTLIWNLWKCE